MLLVVDVGNTNITIGVYDKDDLRFTSRVSTGVTKTDDQYATELSEILRSHDLHKENILGSIISSVVPLITGELCLAIEKLFSFKPIIVDHTLNVGLDIKMDNPETVGADLIVGAVAAKEIFPNDHCLILDLGTAITLVEVTESREIVRGSIMPGVNTSLNALCAKTALLPTIGLENVKEVLCSNTIDCMRSGFIYGFSSMIDGMCEKARSQINTPVKIVATGGEARLIIPHCKEKIVFDDHLLLRGLKLIYDKVCFDFTK